MKRIDYFLRNWRYSVVDSFIPRGCELLDIGGFDGSFLLYVYNKISRGVCIDPLIEENRDGKIEFLKARVTDKLPFPASSFDVISMIAVFEHLAEYRKIIVSECFRILKMKGFVILTVPSSSVDNILKILVKMKLIDGMSLEEHSHFRTKETVEIFETCGFQLKRWVKFQLHLNNLFIFEKTN
jgi:ubiquinone/menaquinone biosynthesis C-methylase UbiE